MNILDLISGATGGAQQHINKQMVEEYSVLLPENSILMEFQKKIEPIFGLLREKLLENESLEQSQNLLLAKLIN